MPDSRRKPDKQDSSYLDAREKRLLIDILATIGVKEESLRTLEKEMRISRSFANELTTKAKAPPLRESLKEIDTALSTLETQNKFSSRTGNRS